MRFFFFFFLFFLMFLLRSGFEPGTISPFPTSLNAAFVPHSSQAGKRVIISLKSVGATCGDVKTSIEIEVEDCTSPSSFSAGVIAGIVVGAAAVVALAILGAIFVHKQWNASKANFQGSQSSDYQLMDSNSYKY